jgi:hypothetical protein
MLKETGINILSDDEDENGLEISLREREYITYSEKKKNRFMKLYMENGAVIIVEFLTPVVWTTPEGTVPATREDIQRIHDTILSMRKLTPEWRIKFHSGIKLEELFV